MRRYYYSDDPDWSLIQPCEIAALIGRIIGKLMLLGTGFVIGQVIRGFIQALMLKFFGFKLPGLF